MPAFAFWKAARQDRVQEPLLVAEKDPIPSEPDTTPIIPKNLDLDLDPGNEDNGVFLFHETMIEPHSLPHVQLEKAMEAWDMGLRRSSRESKLSKESKEEKMCERSSPASPKRSSSSTTTTTQKVVVVVAAVDLDISTTDPLFPAPLSPSKQAKTPKYDLEKPLPVSTPSKDQKPEVCTHNTRTRTPSPRPTSFPALDIPAPAPTTISTPPLSPIRSSSPPKSFSPTRTDSIVRLRRPADLNLGTTCLSDPSSPRSELEQRQAVIRNSKSQSKAALRSPTTLLQERLNMPVPRKPKSSNTTSSENTPKTRIFTPPPQAPENGCWLPGPGAHVPAFTSTSIRARTEASKRPAWWCKFDKLVVFDGISISENGDEKIMTRTSKGLSIARRQGDVESIVIPLDCAHCQEMLNRHEWKYDMRVCKRSVCWDCKERCRWEAEMEREVETEMEREEVVEEGKSVGEGKKVDGNRGRADSVLQEEE